MTETIKQERKAKNFKFGMEFELFILNNDGSMAFEADRLIKRVNKTDSTVDVGQEVGKNMIEVRTLAGVDIKTIMLKAMKDLEVVLDCARKENLILYPFGTYPGSFIPVMRQQPRYLIQERIFGRVRKNIRARVVGLHCHFTLPWGVFDVSERTVKNLINSKNKQSLVNMYNLFIAIDPALTTFMQSSPFYEGKFLGKDSRVIVYRGGRVFNYPEGVFANYPAFGALPKYRFTGTDLLNLINERYQDWVGVTRKLGIKRPLTKYGSVLNTTWGPVKISAHGTLEQRGMDMNYPRVIIALACLIKYLGTEIQEKFVNVLPSDSAIAEPFRVVDGRVLIPPESYVRFTLQPKAAQFGLADDAVYNYCRALLRLIKPAIPQKELVLIQPLEEMVRQRKTVSDQILDKAAQLKVQIKEGIDQKKAAELAVWYADHFRNEIESAKAVLEKI